MQDIISEGYSASQTLSQVYVVEHVGHILVLFPDLKPFISGLGTRLGGYRWGLHGACLNILRLNI